MSLSASAPWLKYYGEVPHHLTYPQKTIYQMVRDAAIRDARLPAYEFMGKKTTFAQFMEKIDQTAQAFLAMGIQKGDRVTICMPNCPQALHAFYGLNRIGAVSNMIHPLSAAGEIKFYLNFSHSKCILTLDQFYAKIAPVMPEPVSYTHLDVYKRQATRCSRPRSTSFSRPDRPPSPCSRGA